MKDYGFGYLAIIGVFLVCVAIVAMSALPMIATMADRISVLGR